MNINTAHIKKHCPECGAVLTVRTNRANGSQFMGCTRYPECQHTEPIPLDIILRAQGAQTLPGFE